MNKTILFGGILGLVLVSTAGSTQALLADLGEFMPVEIRDENGDVMLRQTLEASNPLLMKTEHFLLFGGAEPSNDAAKPGSGGADPGTDCESDAYRTAGWYWNSNYNAQSDSYSSLVNGALGEWGQVSGFNGGAGGGDNGNAGVYDGVNQLEWENIGAGSTVAVTTTWSYRGSGIAVESDGQYNTYYAWSTSGASNAMDAESVIQHETGHTAGLNHPSGSGIECLTMYAYVNYGWTHGRTLGDGDILGVKAIYGN